MAQKNKKLNKIELNYLKNLDNLTLEQKNRHDIITARHEIFNETRRLKGKKTEVLVIDDDNKLFYHLMDEKADFLIFTPIHTFSEVISCEYKSLVEQKQIVDTQKKGGVGRAVVGGALFGVAGAIVGASTAKTETTVKNVDVFKGLELQVQYGGGVMGGNDVFRNPPPGAVEFFKTCIAMNSEA